VVIEADSQHNRSESGIEHGGPEMKRLALLLLPDGDVVGVTALIKFSSPRQHKLRAVIGRGFRDEAQVPIKGAADDVEPASAGVAEETQDVGKSPPLGVVDVACMAMPIM